LLLCFGALALSQATGILADTGTLIYGDGHRHRTVRIGDHVARTRQTIDAIGATCRSREPPPLILNRHCAVCDFQSKCRGLAIERDDLSLLTAMTGKERAKCNTKGIVTVTQLSYGYRHGGGSAPDLTPSVPQNPPNGPPLSPETTTNSRPWLLRRARSMSSELRR
jgi:predicted RecB family nuclease